MATTELYFGFYNDLYFESKLTCLYLEISTNKDISSKMEQFSSQSSYYKFSPTTSETVTTSNGKNISEDEYKFSVIIVAAGSGSRFQSETPKQFLKINNKLVVQWSVDVFSQISHVREIIVVVPENYIDFAKSNIKTLNSNIILKFCIGGKLRQNSVENGLKLVEHGKWVIVHDAARPAITKEMVIKAMNCALNNGNAVLAVKSKDTLANAIYCNQKCNVNYIASEKLDNKNEYYKQNSSSNGNLIINSYLDRDFVYLIQTPQIFKVETLKKAYQIANSKNIIATDDSSLVKQIGEIVYLVEGSYFNIKLTTKEDLVLLQTILSSNSEYNLFRLR